MFKAGVHELTMTKESPEDPGSVGTSCLIAAGIYLLFILFCSCQVSNNIKIPLKNNIFKLLKIKIII